MQIKKKIKLLVFVFIFIYISQAFNVTILNTIDVWWLILKMKRNKEARIFVLDYC